MTKNLKTTIASVENKDITDRKRAEEALQESEAKYKTLLIGAAEGILVADLETKQFRYVNPAVCRMFGYTEEELIRLCVTDIHPKESLDHVLSEFETQARGEKTLAQLPCLRKDGTVFYSNITAISMVVEGHKCNVGFFTDITELKRIEDALRESEHSFAITFNSIGDAVIATDAQGRIFRMNLVAEQLTGWPLKEALGRSLDEVFHIVNQHTRLPVENPVSKVFETGKIQGLANDTVLVSRQGTEHIIADSAAAIMDDQTGKAVGVVLVFRDQTREYAMQEVLRERVKELNCLYAIANLIEKEDSLEKILQGSADLMPNAWFYPEIACARITFEGRQYQTGNFRETDWRLSADLSVNGRQAGVVELCYLEERPVRDKGPFLKDERNLINGIAERLGRVAERKRAIEARDSILKTAQDGFWLVDAATSRLVDVNASASSMLGYTREEFLARGLADIDDQWSPEELGREMQNVKTTGKAFFETRHRAKDGQIIDVEISVNYLATTDQFVSFIRDITERKKAEEMLRESRQRFQGLVETLYDWVWEVDPKEHYTYVSPRIRAILGYEPEELLGKTPFDMMPAEEAQRVSKIFGLLAAEQKPVIALENINLHKDGHPVFLETSGLPFYDAQGKLKGYRGIDRDITERKRLEEEKRCLEERSRKVVEDVFRFIPEGVLVFSRKMELLRQNQAFRELASRYAKRLCFDEDELKNLIIDKVKAGLRDNNLKEIRIARKHEAGK